LNDDDRGGFSRWALPVTLIALTFLTTTNAGALMWPGARAVDVPYLPVSVAADFWSGLAFSVPLMSILLAHEFGHYIAGRLHGVPISPPFFIPMPGFLLGTMGAVIRMSGTIRTRNALLDVGAAGPLAGLAVALPVLVYGIATSPVEVQPTGGGVPPRRTIRPLHGAPLCPQGPHPGR
jgi:membrane-associated protease RseP (regulator of RpoE activity)